MAVTAHYIDNNWHFRTHMLRFLYVTDPHTSERLAPILVRSMMDQNVDAKSNVKKILEEGGTVEAANQLVCGGKEHDPSYMLGRLIRKKQPQDRSVAPPQLSQITT